jgi:hypothetical protein
MTNGIWLIDFINSVQLISETYFILYIKQINNTKKALLSEYCKVVIELREVFINLLTKVNPLATIRRNIFNINFRGSKKDIFTTKGNTGRENSLLYS